MSGCQDSVWALPIPEEHGESEICVCVLVAVVWVVLGESISSQPAGPHGRLAQKTVIGPLLLGTGEVDTIAQGLPDLCDSYTACRLEPMTYTFHVHQPDIH